MRLSLQLFARVCRNLVGKSSPLRTVVRRRRSSPGTSKLHMRRSSVETSFCGQRSGSRHIPLKGSRYEKWHPACANFFVKYSHLQRANLIFGGKLGCESIASSLPTSRGSLLKASVLCVGPSSGRLG